ncbi:MAG: thioredoxin family protein [Epsilonproteobacteria bacterium]|nr:thioredoxin family protein [Campylobacterota bacterium]
MKIRLAILLALLTATVAYALTPKEIEQKITDQNSGPIVLLAYFGTGCPPCTKFKPIFEGAKKTLGTKYTFISFDAKNSNNSWLRNKYVKPHIPTVPAPLLINNGQVVKAITSDIRPSTVQGLVDMIESTFATSK